MNCKDCKFAKDLGVIYCLRYPKTVLKNKTDWCGEHQQKTNTTKKK